MTGKPYGLRKTITLRHAVALYVSSALGSGVLVLPGVAAQRRGPAHWPRGWSCPWRTLPVCIHLRIPFRPQSRVRGHLRFCKRSLRAPGGRAACWLCALGHCAPRR